MRKEPKIHVLLVEDDPMQAAMTRSLLRQQFDGALRLWETTHVEVAVTHLQDPSVEVVLLDLDLPDSRGMATVKRVIKAAPEVPVVVLTGHDDHNMRQAALAHGAHAYLVKGVASGPVIEEAVSNAARRRRIITEAPPIIAPAVGRSDVDFPRGNGQRILLVEGQATLRSTLTQMLRGHGYGLQAATDGNEALKYFISAPGAVDIVVVDLFASTPGRDTLCRAVRRLNPVIPIIMSAGADNSAEAAASSHLAAELEGIHLLLKPHASDALLRLLHQVLSPASEP